MPGPDSQIRLVVVFGGVSAEHDVSCVSASHVLAAVDRTRYDVVPVGVTRQGEWVLSEASAKALAEGPEALPESLPTEGPTLSPLTTVVGEPGEPVTVVFPLIHGPLGEDGTLQGMLELAGVPYVGSGVLGSAVCMDKVAAKALTAAAGIAQCRHLAARERDVDEAFEARVLAELGLPVFVKPANLGSSIGISKAHDAVELREALATALRYDEWVVVEEAVSAREIEVAVLGNAEPRASRAGEIVPAAEFYDYDDKYSDGAADLLIPAPLEPQIEAQVQALAIDSYRALRCDGMARVDFFYEEDGRGFLLNEVNTIPGFTPISMYPSLWAQTDLPYSQLIDELVWLALDRHAQRDRVRRAGSTATDA